MGRIAHGPGLADHLWTWHRNLSDDVRRGPAQRLLLFLGFNRIILVCVPLFELLNVLDIVLADDLEQTRVPVRSLIGCATGGISLEIMARRRHVAREAFALTASAAAALEDDPAWPADRAILQREARTAYRRTVCVFLQAALVGVSVFLTVQNERSAVSCWMTKTGGWAGWVGRSCILLVNLIIITSAHIALYTLSALQLTLAQACTALNRRIACRFKAMAGWRHTARNALLHGRVREAARLLSQFFGHLLVGYHMVGFLLPMIGTVELIIGGGSADAFVLATVPLIFTFFVSQAVFGQRMETSSEDVGWAAYQGPWPTEDAASRRARLIVVQSALRPSRFGVPGLLVLNHATCQHAMRTWFQYIQILLNVNGRRGQA